MFVAKLKADGALDTSFASTSAIPGVLMIPALRFNTDYGFSLLRVRCDGRFLVTGSQDTGYAAAARVGPTGALDTFGDAGIAASAAAGLGIGAVEDPTSGRFVLMGRNGSGQLQLERYNP